MPKLYNLTKTECSVLYRKYTAGGLNPKDANDRIDKIKDHLKKVVEKLKAEEKSHEEIETRFKEEFEKICMEVEYEFT